MNICGCLVHVALDQTDHVRAAIDATTGAEVHTSDGEGRFVVVVEDTDARLASEIIMDLHQIPGVISLTLTYHHFEEPQAGVARSPVQSQPQAGGQNHDFL